MSEERVYRRRVQVVGGGTLAITLPKAWAKRFGVEPGSELSIVVDPSGCLRVYPPNLEVKRRASVAIELEPTVDSNTVVRLVIAHYLAGYHSIRLVFPPAMSSEVAKAIEILRSKVLGLEVLEEDSSSITLYTVVDPEFMEFEAVVKRMARVSLSMLQDLGIALESRDRTLLESIARRDDLVDKLYLLAMKQLSDKLSNPLEAMHPLQGIYLSIALKCIERVADHARSIALILQRCEDEIPKLVVELYNKSIEIFRSATDALINLDVRKAIEIARVVDRAREEENAVRGSIQRIDMCTDHVLEGIRRILAYSVDIAEVVIDIDALRKYIETEVEVIQKK